MSDLYEQLLRGQPGEQRLSGVMIGIVTNNRDPEKLGRVKVRFPRLSDRDESGWARVAAPMAGKERGVFFLPEVDDEVLVAFEQGLIDCPVIVGSLWNGADAPPEVNADGKNNVRLIKSRSGHTVRLTDKAGAEQIEIVDGSGKNSVVIDTAKNSITITADSDLSITAKSGTLKLSGKSVEIVAQADLKVESGTDLNIKGGAQLNLKGSIVNIN